jgi:hypothetical protein
MHNPSRSFIVRYCITVALVLGTAWAIRGQFGHEYGAAWAGAIGMLSVIVLSGRQDWYARLPAIVAVSAIAWGASGIMSYGIVVGYGRSDSFPNVLYGLSMLFVIGGLYGVIGGGLSGLTLETKADRRVDWASLITQMIAGGFLFWAILIHQLGYKMTPPRTELWAASLGASCALVWFLYRNQYHSSLRVALWAMLGAGFGFALGNFLQTLGTVTGIDFNWWNVMEYAIGFFGGLGMAYGIVTGQWPEKQTESGIRLSNLSGAFLLIIILPLINMIEATPGKRFLELGQSLGYDHLAQFVSVHHLIAWSISFLMAILLILLVTYYCYPQSRIFSGLSVAKRSRSIFFLYFVWFMLLSNLVGGTWINGRYTSQHLYWVNLLVIGLLLRNLRETEKPGLINPVKWRRTAFLIFIMIMVSILIMSLISVNIHHGLPGMHYRF